MAGRVCQLRQNTRDTQLSFKRRVIRMCSIKRKIMTIRDLLTMLG